MIVITTPTGTIGKQVLEQVLKAELPVRIIVRDPAKLSADVRERVEVIQGSTDDLEVVNTAFAGADVVFWIVPLDDDANDLEGHYHKFNTIAAAAIKAQNVQRIVWVSTLGSDMSKMSGYLRAALAGDKSLEETSVAARILCPATFMDNLMWQVSSIKEQGKFFWANAADQILHNVATRDIALKAAEFLLDPTWIGQERVPLVGPDNLTPNEMATMLAKVLGKPVRFQKISPEAYKANMMQFGSSDTVAQGLADMAVAQSEGFYKADATVAQRTSTSFQTWCEEMLKPAVLG